MAGTYSDPALILPGAIGPTEIAEGAVTLSKLAAESLPAGVIYPYGGAVAPPGFLLCDGAAISRTTYAALFSAIGTAYGVGDGSTTFNLPDMQGNVPVGKGGSGVTNIGDAGGEQTHTLILNEIPAHTHNLKLTAAATGNPGYFTSATTTSSNNKTSDSAGGGAAHNNMQPYVGTEYIIKT